MNLSHWLLLLMRFMKNPSLLGLRQERSNGDRLLTVHLDLLGSQNVKRALVPTGSQGSNAVKCNMGFHDVCLPIEKSKISRFV